MENYKQAHKNVPKSGRGLGHVTPTIFGSTVGYPSDSFAYCSMWNKVVVGQKFALAVFDTVVWH